MWFISALCTFTCMSFVWCPLYDDRSNLNYSGCDTSRPKIRCVHCVAHGTLHVETAWPYMATNMKSMQKMLRSCPTTYHGNDNRRACDDRPTICCIKLMYILESGHLNGLNISVFNYWFADSWIDRESKIAWITDEINAIGRNRWTPITVGREKDTK